MSPVQWKVVTGHEDNPKAEDDLKNEENLKNKNNLKN